MKALIDSSEKRIHGAAEHVLTAVALHVPEAEIAVDAEHDPVACAECTCGGISNVPYVAHE